MLERSTSWSVSYAIRTIAKELNIRYRGAATNQLMKDGNQLFIHLNYFSAHTGNAKGVKNNEALKWVIQS